MNKVYLLVLLVLVALILAAMGGYLYQSRPQPSRWTSDSPRAVAELELALEAWKKRYGPDTQRHLARALELDPDFAMAHFMRLVTSHDAGKSLEHLRTVDLTTLAPLESTLVRYLLARYDGEPERAETLLALYLETHPNDPLALSFACEASWDRLDWKPAERCYQQLLERHPNWVVAQNHLGYLAMGGGRFREAEERFQAYAFVAPDQANPHDSMGELQMLLGRYPEAEQEFRKALEIKSDFCPAYEHLFSLMVTAGAIDRARELIDERDAQSVCVKPPGSGRRCYDETLIAYAAGDFEGAWQIVQNCPEPVEKGVLTHQLALLTGRDEEAAAIEAALRTRLEKSDGRRPGERMGLRSALLHVEATRLLVTGQPDAAADLYRQADELILYWSDRQWFFKLTNRLYLQLALELAGHEQEARAMAEKIAEVNPRFTGPRRVVVEALESRARAAM